MLIYIYIKILYIYIYLLYIHHIINIYWQYISIYYIYDIALYVCHTYSNAHFSTQLHCPRSLHVQREIRQRPVRPLRRFWLHQEVRVRKLTFHLVSLYACSDNRIVTRPHRRTRFLMCFRYCQITSDWYDSIYYWHREPQCNRLSPSLVYLSISVDLLACW